MNRPSDDLLPLEAALARIDAWFALYRPRYFAALHQGTAETDGLPEPVRLLLDWHNGQSADFAGCFEENWFLMSADEIRAADVGKTGWTPFLDDDAGDYLCVDAAGAVRLYSLGETEQAVVAPSLTAWMRGFADHLERGDYGEDPERGILMRKQ
jgi:cell wall assembly regulator SMI1